ncbi:hypothetical protein BaRGS_00029777 [Batillaria attramentaria]|uniref:Uncharacterized protein n=1 Tax=Batillaria attramentaria TaxID=370345 RepID=A0ABD0JV89_9CAEN
MESGKSLFKFSGSTHNVTVRGNFLERLLTVACKFIFHSLQLKFIRDTQSKLRLRVLGTQTRLFPWENHVSRVISLPFPSRFHFLRWDRNEGFISLPRYAGNAVLPGTVYL